MSVVAFAALCIAIAAVGVCLDVSLHMGPASGLPYLALVLLGLWSPRTPIIFVLAGASTALTLLGDSRSSEWHIGWSSFTEHSLPLFAFWTTAAFGYLYRARHEGKLSNAEARFRFIFEGAPIGIAILDTKGRVENANTALCGVLRRPIDEIAEQPLSRFIDPDDSKEFLAHFGEVAADKSRTGSRVWRALGANDQRIWVRVNFAPDLNLGGQPGRIIASIEDVTQTKQEVDRFQRFVESALDALVMVNEQGEIVLVNEQTEKLFGYDRSELIGRAVEILVPPAGRERHRETRRRYLTEPAPRHIGENADDLQGFTKGGKPFPVEISLNPVITEDARLVVAAIRDVTDSKRTEHKLEQSRKLLTAASERLSAALNALPANIALLNREGEITLVNRGWEAFAEANGCADPGYSLRRNYLKICAQAVEDGLPDAERVHEGLTAILAGRAQSFSYEYAAHSADEQRWFQMNAAALPHRLGAVVMHIDVTNRLETEQQLSRAQKMEAIGQLTGGIAHDFNNLLMVIDGYARRSLSHLDERESAEGSLQEVLKATEKATDLTRQLLVFSRRQIMEKKRFRVDEAIEDIKNLLRRSVSDRYELRFELSASNACVNTDRGELDQALLNLTVNARDAMPKGGTIMIGSRITEFDDAMVAAHDGATAGRFVEIFVKDQGCGMDKATRERIFEPFFTTKDQGKGTGLGLAMIYGFCRQSGGIVDVLSTPGEGATFMMFLPAVEGEPQIRENIELGEDYRGKGERILVVEDDEALLDLTAGILVDHGYEVLRAGNGMEALEVDDDCEQSIDLLLSDVMMPGLGGFEVAELIREKRPDLHVIFMSGYPKNDRASDSTVPFHSHFLQKPVKPARLLQVVRQELDEATAIPR